MRKSLLLGLAVAATSLFGLMEARAAGACGQALATFEKNYTAGKSALYRLAWRIDARRERVEAEDVVHRLRSPKMVNPALKRCCAERAPFACLARVLMPERARPVVAR